MILSSTSSSSVTMRCESSSYTIDTPGPGFSSLSNGRSMRIGNSVRGGPFVVPGLVTSVTGITMGG